MRYALIRNNKVENVIIADEEFIKHLAPKYDYIENVDGKRIGSKCSYDPVKKIFGDPPLPPPPPLPSLGELKASKLAQLETVFQNKTKEPISDADNNCSWFSNSESAMLIDRAIRLVQLKSSLTVDLYDTANKVHTLSIPDAQKVFILVAGASQTLYVKKIAKINEIKNAATIDDLKNVAITLQDKEVGSKVL